MDAYFVRRSIGKIVLPRATIAGVIYTNLDLGVKEVVVTLIGSQRIKNVTFFLSPGGLKTHYSEVDFATLYRPDDIVFYADEQTLRTALEQLPCCTTIQDGSAPGDLLNLVLICEAEEFLSAFIDRHCDMTEKI